jgi:hypothetical protein
VGGAGGSRDAGDNFEGHVVQLRVAHNSTPTTPSHVTEAAARPISESRGAVGKDPTASGGGTRRRSTAFRLLRHTVPVGSCSVKIEMSIAKPATPAVSSVQRRRVTLATRAAQLS